MSNNSKQNNSMVSPRSILKYFLAVAQDEGAGARVRRSIGTIQARNFSPFLMLDHFSVGQDAGFPDHPHFGFSTVTYLIEGMFAHEDFTGSKGILRPGDLQFMTAGKGIVHAEMPVKTDDGAKITGMQLWVDLPQDEKEIEPVYRDLKREEIPIVKPNDKVTVKVIAGEAYGVKSVQDLAKVAVDYYDYEVAPGGEFEQKFPSDYNVFLYILEGGLVVGDQKLEQYSVAFFKRDGDSVKARVSDDQVGNTRLIVLGGQVLDQPIVQHGPFVTTTREKMYEVFSNYQYGVEGFKNAHNWASSISKGITFPQAKKLLEAAKIPIKDEL